MKLTPEQQAVTNRIIDDYVQIGLSIQPINRDAAAQATLSLYDALESKRPRVILYAQSPFASAIGGLLLDRVLDKRSYPWDDAVTKRVLDEAREELVGQISGVDAETLQAILQDVASQIQSQKSALGWSLGSASLGLAWNLLRINETMESEEAIVAWKKKAPTLKEAILRHLTRDKGAHQRLAFKRKSYHGRHDSHPLCTG